MIKKYLLLSLTLALLVSTAGVTTALAAENGDNGPRQPGNWANGRMRALGQARGQKLGMKPLVVGTVSAINGNTLTISGRSSASATSSVTTFTVDASKAKIIKNNATSSISNIAVGDRVVIQGTVSGTNVVATTIRDGLMMRGGQGGREDDRFGTSSPIGNGQPIVAGAITSINGSTIIINNKSNATYTIDAASAKVWLGRNNNGSLADLKTGDMITAQGTINGSSVIASNIISQIKPAGAQTARSSFLGGIGQFLSRLFGF